MESANIEKTKDEKNHREKSGGRIMILKCLRISLFLKLEDSEIFLLLILTFL